VERLVSVEAAGDEEKKMYSGKTKKGRKKEAVQIQKQSNALL